MALVDHVRGLPLVGILTVLWQSLGVMVVGSNGHAILRASEMGLKRRLSMRPGVTVLLHVSQRVLRSTVGKSGP